MAEISDDDLQRWLALPEVATEPGAAFYLQHIDDLVSLSSEAGHIASMRKLRVGLAEALSPDEDPREAKPELFDSLATIDAEYQKGARFRQEVLATRHIDNYLTYVSEMVAALFILNPRALTSNEQIRIADVLAHSRMDEFVEWLADDRINRLSFKGFSEISEYVQARLGLPLVPEGDLKRRLIRSIATRNLLIHRRGIVDRRYLAALSREGFQTDGMEVGARIADCEAIDTLTCVLEAVDHFEKVATEKFDLERHPIDSPRFKR